VASSTTLLAVTPASTWNAVSLRRVSGPKSPSTASLPFARTSSLWTSRTHSSFCPMLTVLHAGEYSSPSRAAGAASGVRPLGSHTKPATSTTATTAASTARREDSFVDSRDRGVPVSPEAVSGGVTSSDGAESPRGGAEGLDGTGFARGGAEGSAGCPPGPASGSGA
jgi:hypothetical protein